MRTSGRIVGTAAAVAAAGLVLAGCGGDSGGDGSGGGGASKDPKPSKSESTSPASPSQEAPQEATGDLKKLAGTWVDKKAITGQSGKMLGLVILKNQVATAGSGKDSSCQGTFTSDKLPASFSLKCQKPGAGYDQGKITKVQGQELTVSWQNGKTQTLTKSGKPGQAPTDLPTGNVKQPGQ